MVSLIDPSSFPDRVALLDALRATAYDLLIVDRCAEDGRPLAPADRGVAEALLAGPGAELPTLHAIVEGLVLSDAFRRRPPARGEQR